MAKRQCAGTNKAGKPCRSTSIRDNGFCFAHQPDEVKASHGFGGSDNGKLGGRPAMPKPSDVARRLIEQNVLVLQKPYWRTLGYDVKLGENGPYLIEIEDGGAKLYGESREGDIVVSSAEDLGAQITAAEKLQDRVYGKPKQTTEISGPNGDGIRFDMPLDVDDKSTRAARLLAQNGLVPLAVTTNGNGNGSNGHHN